MDFVTSAFFVLITPVLLLGLVELVYYPLALAFELRCRKECAFNDPQPLVSIIVPAFNEERVITNCIDSILTDKYRYKEIFLVDDGSTDGTLAAMNDTRISTTSPSFPSPTVARRPR